MTEPFLRPATAFGALARPLPDGWRATSIGRWRGRPVEVAYDPTTHDVAIFRSTAPAITAALANNGWRLRGRDSAREWWSRDRVSAERRRAALTRRSDGIAVAR